jgi:hypothetical protein
VASTPIASSRPPTRQSQSWAVVTVLTACRSGRLELDQAEQRLHAIYMAKTLGEIYGAIDGLPHPPAPLVLDR